MRMMTYLFVLSCMVMPVQAEPPSPPKGYRWEINPDYTDEFNGTSLDLSKWHDHHPRWRGRPPAKFMPDNVSVKDGLLRLTNGMLEEPQGEFTMGGAAVVSRKTGAHYGYYECRLKASGISMSSTFWMSNAGNYYPGIGKVSQELDILETVGGAKKNPAYAHYMNSNTHVWHNGSRQVGNKAKLPGKADEEFNIYAAWWEDPNTVHFYLNNEHVGTVEVDTSLIPEPFAHPMHVNMVTETYDWESPPTPDEISDTSRNTTFIDWVRAYVLVPEDGSLPEWELKKVFTDHREWRSADGKSSIMAKLVQVRFDTIDLEKKDGTTVNVPVRQLCEDDRELIRQVIRSERSR